MKGEFDMKLVDAMIMSSKGVTIVSSVTRKRYKTRGVKR